MPVPTALSDLSTTANDNYPAGSENPTVVDDHLRAHAALIATLRDGKGASAEVDVASAATCDIGAAASPFVRVTGTTTITSLGTTYNGHRFIRFAGALTLTHNSTTLVLPGSANITTAAGDTCIAIPYGAGTGWLIQSYQGTQAWQNVASSRSVGVTYTNSTGRPIQVGIRVASAAGQIWTLTIGGVVVQSYSANGMDGTFFAVIPAGASYVLTGGTVVNAWSELR